VSAQGEPALAMAAKVLEFVEEIEERYGLTALAFLQEVLFARLKKIAKDGE
jgi:hypothetical protein